MTTRLARFPHTAILLTLLVPGMAYAQIPTPASAVTGAKLDESLRETVERGCTGTRAVIITTKPGYREGLRASLTAHGDVVTGEFPALDAVAATVHCDDLRTLASFRETRAISADAPVGVQAADAKDQAPNAHKLIAHQKAPGRRRELQGQAAAALQWRFFSSLAATKVRSAKPLDNFGKHVRLGTPAGILDVDGSVGVAVIDSGIEPGTDFDDRITGFYDFSYGDIRVVAPYDDYGHGTHVAGLIASRFVGVAPNARLIGLKVLNESGQGRTANVVRAIEFAVANKIQLNIQTLNVSLGHPIYEPAATDPLVQAVEHAVRNGLTVVVSAGNFGVSRKTGEPAYAGIISPANAPSAVTAGAAQTFDTVTRLDDRVARWSSRGPTWYDGFAKPDVVAPGENVLSVAAVDSKLRSRQESRGNTGDYMRLSGTSVAAGITSGVVALVLQNNAGLTPNALKAVLEYSAILVNDDEGEPYDALTQGAGQIEAEGAVALARAIDADAPLGSTWLSYDVSPSTGIDGTTYSWSQQVIWGNHIARGTDILKEQRPAWALDIVWGDGLPGDNILWGSVLDDDNIVWGNLFDEDDNIVWGNNLVWASLLDDDNIVWGNLLLEGDDNIVWGNNIVWGDGLIGFLLDDDNIVWGNLFDDDNIVWGNLDDDNVVWGNLFDFDDDNIVWGNVGDGTFDLLGDDDNIVWGNTAELGTMMQWSGGLVSSRASNARARRTRVGGVQP